MEKEYKVLASGIDSLDLSMDLSWINDDFFKYLEAIKEVAREKNIDQVVLFPDRNQLGLLKPYGRKGYEWIIENDDYTLAIGNWRSPISRPSVMVSIRSIALWHTGAPNIVDYLESVFECAGATIAAIKPSRIDLCIDIALPSSLWNIDLVDLRVSPATYAAPHFNNSNLTGISIGKGTVAGRIYDKALEIKQKSKKYWMYDIWDIDHNFPEDIKIIRVEGQFRREAIKELGIDLIQDTFSHLDNLWAYFTKNWLKFQNNPGKHHTMRRTLEWWQVIQNSFLGVQEPTPLIRCKALNQKRKQLYAQTSGTLMSILALDHEITKKPLGASASLKDLQNQFRLCFYEFGKSDFELEIDLFSKRAKVTKTKSKCLETHKKRKSLGLPSNILPNSEDL